MLSKRIVKLVKAHCGRAVKNPFGPTDLEALVR